MPDFSKMTKELKITDLLYPSTNSRVKSCIIWSQDEIADSDLAKVVTAIMKLSIEKNFSCFNPELGTMLVKNGFLKPLGKQRLVTIEILNLRFFKDAGLIRQLKRIKFKTFVFSADEHGNWEMRKIRATDFAVGDES